MAVLLFCTLAASTAGAQTTYGTLNNFDVFNDTGEGCHGFEIELDGVSAVDVPYTFGSPYQRYGNPSVVDFAGGVYIRYESPYDAVNHVFTETTPLAPTPITPTAGHACWTGGSANYLTSGCEHFGVGVNGNPTGSAYRWLIADPNTPGALQPSGTKVSIPAPVWNVSPPPQPGGQAVVQAVLPAEPPEVNQQFGDAMWVKVFVTESDIPAELHHLVTDDPSVPGESETEMEWALLQDGPGGGNNELVNEGKVKDNKKSVTRRYEFYRYTGGYDAESHEAICLDGTCSTPAPSELGDYIGAQMAAVNLDPIVESTPTVTPTEGIAATPTATEPVLPTPTSTPAAPACLGDCNGDCTVAIGELQIGLNLFFGVQSIDTCPAFDPEQRGSVGIGQLQTGLNNFFGSCPSGCTPR